ncbi:unnamed protein product [Dracunculus medinensis]|uniref:Beta-1,4-glucuronyltransferase 1 n=1 Tax=Dracunculus medinensis TaxID=318479 RepID=A0A0N4ULQ5_DRAME|nr:unnamed protein product [Dracunculus medinensis]
MFLIYFSFRFLKYKNYCVLPYVKRSSMENSLEILDRITLIIHISENYLDHRLIEQVEAWDGPVTLAIIIPSFNIFDKIRNVQIKLLHLPVNVLEKLSAHIIFESNISCTTNSVKSLNDFTTISKYPINIARNIARMFIPSKYVIIGDYEFIFSQNFEQKMRPLAKQEFTKNPKSVLVFRTFEINESVVRLPRDKSELKKLYSQGLAVQFHAKFNQGGHAIPDLPKWFNYPENNHTIIIDKILKFDRHGWEPQFISLNTIPFHDENFPYSIRDNTVLRWEMCRQNYTFMLLNNVFMMHKGIKTVDDIPKVKEMQSKVKSQFITALALFNKRMDDEYPETKRNCPTFRA